MLYTIHITHTSMGVKVELPTFQYVNAIKAWAENILHAPKMGKNHGRITLERGDAFYVYLEQTRSFIFHKSYYDQLLSIIKNVGIRFNYNHEIKEHWPKRLPPYSCTFENHGFQMEVDDPDSRFFYQNDVVDTACSENRTQTIFAIQTGRGKALRHGTPVRIPNGWKLIEQIRLGDIVIGKDGKPTNVIGVFPQPLKKMFRVTFADGRNVDVCGEHLWETFYVNTTEARRWAVRDTNEIKRLISLPNPRVYIPLPEPEETTAKDLPVEPYLLGALLGDGYFGKKGLFFSNPDAEVLAKVRSLLPRGHELKPSGGCDHYITTGGAVESYHAGSLPLELEGLGLRQCRSVSKFIPDVYLEGSIEQRWELLRGLMDTDGTVNKDGGQPSFCSVSLDLANGVAALVRSLGGIAKITTKKPTFTYKGEKKEGQLAYNVFIRHRTPSKLFSLTHKKDLCRDDGQYTSTLKLRVLSVEEVEKDYSTCISVDNQDSLFVVKDWIVTHNTKSFQKVMVKKQVRTGLIHRPTYVDKWIYDCCEDPTGLRVDRDKVLVCRGTEGIIDAYHRAKAGELDRDDIRIVIFPTVSLQNFLKEYSHSSGFGIDLEHFFDVFGIGLVGYDEVHEHFLLVYLSGIMLNPPAVVEMSATLEPGENKTFIRDRYMERFPPANRLSVPYIPVVDVRGFYYSLDDKKVAFWASKMTPYNHKLFEQKLMSTGLHRSYSEMWFELIRRSYLDKYQPGQKVIILFATIDMCAYFTDFCREKLQGMGILSELMVSKYNGGDSYDDFMMADIGVSTPGKAGTAIDKKGMIHMYCTTPIDDQQLNLQIAGRPRPVRIEFKWDLNPKVWFGHCINIPKHGSYLNSRMKSLKDTVLSFEIANSPFVVRSDNANATNSARTRGTIPGPKFKGFSRKGPKGVSRRRRRSR